MERHLSPQLIQRIEELVDASYSGRDELYAAAAALDDERRSSVCRSLADHLADHAIELQQLVIMNGGDKLEPLNMHDVAELYFDVAKRQSGDAGVLSIAEKCERTVKERFDEVLNRAVSDDAAAILERQRDSIQFGENVLRSMQGTTTDDDEPR